MAGDTLTERSTAVHARRDGHCQAHAALTKQSARADLLLSPCLSNSSRSAATRSSSLLFALYKLGEILRRQSGSRKTSEGALAAANNSPVKRQHSTSADMRQIVLYAGMRADAF